MMNSLTLDKAMELYEILGAHVPEVEDENSNALEFIGKIVSNAGSSSSPQDYIDAIILMSGLSLDVIKEMDSGERLELFITGVAENKVIQLKSFCDTMGFNHG